MKCTDIVSSLMSFDDEEIYPSQGIGHFMKWPFFESESHGIPEQEGIVVVIPAQSLFANEETRD